ncbi:unnamed protein product [Ixodes pacificus]
MFRATGRRKRRSQGPRASERTPALKECRALSLQLPAAAPYRLQPIPCCRQMRPIPGHSMKPVCPQNTPRCVSPPSAEAVAEFGTSAGSSIASAARKRSCSSEKSTPIVPAEMLCRRATCQDPILQRGPEGQVVIREGTYFASRCTGKEPSEAQACISCRYPRKALPTQRSRVRRSVKQHVRSIVRSTVLLCRTTEDWCLAMPASSL